MGAKKKIPKEVIAEQKKAIGQFMALSGFEQKDIAVLFGVTGASVSYWRNGHTSMPLMYIDVLDIASDLFKRLDVLGIHKIKSGNEPTTPSLFLQEYGVKALISLSNMVCEQEAKRREKS